MPAPAFFGRTDTGKGNAVPLAFATLNLALAVLCAPLVFAAALGVRVAVSAVLIAAILGFTAANACRAALAPRAAAAG